MNIEIINVLDLFLTNGLIIWLALRMVKRVDDIDDKVDRHETRISVLETEVSHAQEKNVRPAKGATASVAFSQAGISLAIKARKSEGRNGKSVKWLKQRGLVVR